MGDTLAQIILYFVVCATVFYISDISGYPKRMPYYNWPKAAPCYRTILWDKLLNEISALIKYPTSCLTRSISSAELRLSHNG